MMWKRSIPYLAIASVYLGLVVLIVQSWPVLAGTNPLPPETRRYFEISRKVEAEVARLRDLIVADTIIPLIATERLTILMPAKAANVAEYARRRLDREIPRASKAAITVIAVPSHYGSFGFPELGDHRSRYYAGMKDETPFCGVVVPYWNEAETSRVWTDGGHVLGPCAFWARHGAPGSEIHNWLLRGGAEFADERQWFRISYLTEELMIADPRQNRSYSRFALRGQKCQAGKLDACHSGVLQPDSGSRAPTGAMRSGDPWNMRLFPGQGTMLADIEREFGAERFARFWKSTSPVEPAFEAAFGAPLAEWVSDWARQRYGPREYGSRMSPLTILLSIVTISIFAGIAAWAASRRRV